MSICRERPIATFICEATSVAKKPKIKKADECGDVIIDASLQTAEEFNRNTRKYLLKDLLTGLNRPHITELIEAGSWVGAAGHPNSSDIKVQGTYDNMLTSHRINKWWNVGNEILGEIESIDNGDGSPGRLFKIFVLKGAKLAFSLRALGSVTQVKGGFIVQGPLHIVTYDWVVLPSHKGSYQKEIKEIQEGLDSYVKKNGIYQSDKSGKSISQNILLNESVDIPLNESQITSFIKDKSKNLKFISEHYELDMDTARLNDKHDGIILSDSTGEIKIDVRTEKEVLREVRSNYFRGM